MAANSPKAIRSFLKILKMWEKGDIERTVELETTLFGSLWTSKNFRKWLNRFLNKKNSS